MHDKATQSRINGAKSNGPVTDEGKEKVSQNATKHGGYSHRVVIRGESQEIYEKIYLAYWAEYKPETPSEADCVEDIINNRWKIRRFEAIESNYFLMADSLYDDNADFQQTPPDTRHRACFNHLIETQPGFMACGKFLERYQRANARALRNLDRIRKRAGKPSITANTSEVEKEYPSNTTPQPPSAPTQYQNEGISPEPPSSPPSDPQPRHPESGKTILELLLFVLLALSTATFSCRPISLKTGSHQKIHPATIQGASFADLTFQSDHYSHILSPGVPALTRTGSVLCSHQRG